MPYSHDCTSSALASTLFRLKDESFLLFKNTNQRFRTSSLEGMVG